MLTFKVTGPITVPLGTKGLLFTDELRKSILNKKIAELDGAGCYVFSVNGRKREGEDLLIPIYVGKTTKTFRNECFQTEKLNKLNKYLSTRPSKSLYLFLINHPVQKGVNNNKVIGEIEKFLIQQAASVNPKVLNNQHAKLSEWGIKGVIRGGKGRQSKASAQLKKLLEL